MLRDRLSGALAADHCLDGNYHSKTHDIKLRNVTLVIWFDTSFLRTVWRALKRATHRAWRQYEIWQGTGNKESFRRSFLSTDSIILWTICSFHRNRQRYEELGNDPSAPKIIRLSNPLLTTAFFDTLGQLRADSGLAGINQ